MALRNMRSFNPMTGRRTGAYSRISNAADREEYLAHLRKLKGKYHERKAKETEGHDRKFHEYMAKSLLGETTAINLIEPRRSDKYSADQKVKARQSLLKLGTVYKPAKDEYDMDLAKRKREVQKYTGTSPEEKRAQERARSAAVQDIEDPVLKRNPGNVQGTANILGFDLTPNGLSTRERENMSPGAQSSLKGGFGKGAKSSPQISTWNTGTRLKKYEPGRDAVRVPDPEANTITGPEDYFNIRIQPTKPNPVVKAQRFMKPDAKLPTRTKISPEQPKVPGNDKPFKLK